MLRAAVEFGSGMSVLLLTCAILLWPGSILAASEPAVDIANLIESAEAEQRAGRFDVAFAKLGQALRAAERAADPVALAAVAGSLGSAYLATGQLALARQWLEQSLQHARSSVSVALEATSMNNLGNVLAAEEQLRAALAAHDRAERLAADADRPDIAAAAAINAARILIRQGAPDEARRRLERAHAAVSGQAPDAGTIMQLLALGRQWAALDEPQSAFTAYEDARRSAAASNDVRLESYAAGYLGQLYEQAGRAQEALVLTRRAVFLAQAGDAASALYLWQWQMGRLLAAQGEASAAIEAYHDAVRTVATIRPDLLGIEARSGRSALRETIEPIHLELADLLLRRAAATPDPAAKQADLQTARAVVEQLRAAELEDYFRDDCVAELRARVRPIDRLAERTAAIYPIILPQRTVMLLSLPEGLAQVSIPVAAEDLTAEIRKLRQLLEKRTTRQYLPLAQALYERLIRPIEARLAHAGIDTLVFVPDGPLRTIPPAALHDGDRFLIDRYAIATVPSLNLIDPRPVAATGIDPLLNGLTEAVQGFPALPFVARELQAIRTLYGGTVLANDEFVVPEVARSLARTPYTVVHIASHGEFAGEADESFVLTYDGRLTMDELEKLIKLSRFRDEPVELLTLSACRTAAGDDRAALGLAGVAIKAGARSALATLWFINDEASSLLVAAFYRELGSHLRPTKAKALQRAQQAIKADPRYRHPAYWSPFLIIGNWL